MKKFFSKYKKRINNGVRGAISIFLAMILLPVMGFIGLFVDISKVELSKEVVTTSADLALNTMLSQYDRTLMDYYGLFGSCQNYEDVAKTAINYFSNSMVSTSFTTSDAEKYVNWVQKLAGNTSAGKKDMIKTKVSEASIVPDENGSLNNPALMKYEIIEFMKYRAPIDGVESLLSFLNNFMQSSGGTGITLTSANAQTPKIVPLSIQTSNNTLLSDYQSATYLNNPSESYGNIIKLSNSLSDFNDTLSDLDSQMDRYNKEKAENPPPDDADDSSGSETFSYDYKDENGKTVTATTTADDMQSQLEDANGGKSTSDISDSINQFGRITNSLSAALKDASTDLRDNLYTLDYVMNMFSHAAFESEGKYNVKVKQSGSNVSGTFLDVFGAGSRPAYNYSGSITDTWNKSNDKKTLTLVDRCAENSEVYQKEIEYIIDGSGPYTEKSADAARQKIYNKIWTIRFALNAPAVYQHCDTDPTLNLIAEALQLKAGIPTWVTKFILAMPAVLTCETNLDMKTMIDYGAPVILIKNKNQLFGGFVPTYITHVFNEVSPTGFSVHYSDYLKLFFFINFYSDQSNTYGNIGRVIEANVGKVSGKKDYSFDKCIVNFRLKAVVEVAPMWSKIAGASFANDALFSKGWRSMKVDMLRGY